MATRRGRRPDGTVTDREVPEGESVALQQLALLMARERMVERLRGLALAAIHAQIPVADFAEARLLRLVAQSVVPAARSNALETVSGIWQALRREEVLVRDMTGAQLSAYDPAEGLAL